MNFTMTSVWDDTLKLVRDRATLLTAIAGVFIFLPALVIAIFVKPPETQGVSPDRVFQMTMDYYAQAWLWLLGQALLSMISTVAMLRLVFAERTTVGESLVYGVRWLLWYILLSIALSVMLMLCLVPAFVAIGLVVTMVQSIPLRALLAIVLGIATLVGMFYVLARIVLALPVMVAEQRGNPAETIERSFALTRGRGWSIAGLLAVVILVGAISIGIVTAILGILFYFIAGEELGGLLAGIVTSALTSAFATLMVMLYAALYRALAGDPVSAAKVFD